VEARAQAEQRVLVIDPGQAFGTGHHASTRLALDLLDDVLAGLGKEVAQARVLDAGTGSGVLAMGAAALGAARAIGFDLDSVAVGEARANARLNALGGRTGFFIGTLEALAPIPFQVIVANMIRSEVVPLIPGLTRALAPNGELILSGLLGADRKAIEQELARSGLAVAEERSEADSGDRWVGYRLGRVA
jgi:ribosomal protein L11 methyltransferase